MSRWPQAMWVALAFTVTLHAAPAQPDFIRDVRPILTQHCQSCHGAEKQKGGLRVDSREALVEGGDHGPALMLDRPGESRLLKRVLHADPDGPGMPYKEPRLSEEQIGVLTRWIESGAAWPADAVTKPQRITSSHWAFQPIRRAAPPQVKNGAWVRNVIDAFILARLEAQGIKPSPEADRVTLIRRLSLDITGLPPTPQEIDTFLADQRTDAYEQLVDRLLASKHYGERWGRHWLDQARYADSNGYSIDAARVIWPYRDWVINALNADMPFDQFTVEQLAGDLLPKATTQQIVATGFHRNTLINQEGGTDPEQFRVEAAMDRVNTTGAVWLGLTVGCAQCHTHKFDPITQREYYQLYAFFNSGVDRNSASPQLSLPTPKQAAELKNIDAQLKAAAARLAEYEKAHADDRRRWEAEMAMNEGAAKELQDALKVPAEKRSKKQKAVVDAEYVKTDSELSVLTAEVNLLTAKKKALTEKIPTTLVMGELKEPRPSHVLIRGDFLRPGQPVTPDVLQVLPPMQAEGEGMPTRLDLARWLVSPDNPLTPRVTVNRLWMRYFGTGLVETENDFGTQGTPPTHPELLDDLAARFIDSGWSLKAMHKLIVTSATYRQSSQDRPELREVDPLNKLLARQNRVRVEAEVVRDLALAVSGKLSRKIGGPSVFPYQPDGVYAFTQVKKTWKPSTGEDAYRRTLYTFIYRSAPHPMLTTFDAPDFATTCTRRLRSNTPLQSLTVANSPAMLELARARALRQLAAAHDGDEPRLVSTFRACLGRSPDAAEKAALSRYLQSQRAAFAAEPSAALEAMGGEKMPAGVTADEGAAWTAVCRVLMNLDDFITRP